VGKTGAESSWRLHTSIFFQMPLASQGKDQSESPYGSFSGPNPIYHFGFFSSFSVPYIIGTMGYHLDKFIDAAVYSEKAHTLYYNPQVFIPFIASFTDSTLKQSCFFTLISNYYCCYYHYDCSYFRFRVCV
jgi:hypothetical protein